MHYLLQERVSNAKRLLEECNLSVTEVAVAVGFINAAHFSTVFRKQLGLSPSAYRRRLVSTVGLSPQSSI